MGRGELKEQSKVAAAKLRNFRWRAIGTVLHKPEGTVMCLRSIAALQIY
jgi:hypothetical protein